ncbi:MAG: hypothetical protein HKO88_08385, partial [Xanthomonadales bacterium]|nr:hypothetical protein [Xanthomonadales bacterium]
VQYLVAVLLLVFVGSVYAEKPQQVIEQNLDANGDIKVAIQNTDDNSVPVTIKNGVDFPVPVEVKNTVEANITGGELDVNVTGGTVTVDSIPNVIIDSIPSVTIGSMPPVLNGDHPALTSFSQRKVFNVAGGQIAEMYFNSEGNKVCNPGDKMIITTITGIVHGELKTPTSPAAQLPLLVSIYSPVLYYLSDSSYSYDGFSTRYSKVWNEKTNIIIDADYQILLSIWQGPTFSLTSQWYGGWSIFGYCFSP